MTLSFYWETGTVSNLIKGVAGDIAGVSPTANFQGLQPTGPCAVKDFHSN